MNRSAIALLVVLWGGSALFAQPAPAPKAPATFEIAAVDAFIQGQLKAKGFVGLSIAVMRDGKIVLAKGYGTTEVNGGSPITIDTPFAIGSVTKQFACACILLLAEEGKLSVHDPVAKYYPELTRAKDITLYDLMTHTSGYSDYYPLDFLDRRMKAPIPHDELLKRYAGGKLDFEPGSRYSYSNTGYILLGRVVEKVSGEPFAKFVNERIFKPLGMNHSVCEPAADRKDLAHGHNSHILGPTEPMRMEADGWLHAAGGIYSTPSDLARWDLALVEGKILKPESFKLMSSPRGLTSGKTSDYGCGLSISRQGGETVLSHTGAVSGFHAHNVMIPRTRSAIILLANAEHLDDSGLQRELVSLVLKDQAKRETTVPVIAGPPPRDAARELFAQLQSGAIDRTKLGEEFDLYLTAERVRDAAPRLKEYGTPIAVEVDNVGERGGMEAARLRLVFKAGVIRVNMFRSTDGKIQQFLLSK